MSVNNCNDAIGHLLDIYEFLNACTKSKAKMSDSDYSGDIQAIDLAGKLLRRMTQLSMVEMDGLPND